MSEHRKISIRKIIQTIVTLVLVAGIVMAMKSADHLYRGRLVNDVKITVESPSGVGFIDEASVREMLFSNRHYNPLKEAVTALDEHTLEGILTSNPWVEKAQVFTDANRVMHIILTQRVPVVRLFEQDGNSYYLDDVLQAMPLSNHYTHYTPVVTGVPQLHNDSASLIIRGKIVGLVRHISKSAFWSAQISQINMDSDGSFELIPVLGTQRIVLGDTTRLDTKLNKLLAFYKQIQNKVGWDKYTRIDLRFAGQVVASPSLPWKRPKDAAFTNMSWLTAIMETAQKSTSGPGGEAGKDVQSPNVERDMARMPNPAPVVASAMEKVPKKRAVKLENSATKAKPEVNPKSAAHSAQKAAKDNLKNQEKNTKAHAGNR
ncbi:MAG: cell division protein FtsQ/DivIB [Chitinophagaceae bacterium]